MYDKDKVLKSYIQKKYENNSKISGLKIYNLIIILC